MAEKDKETFGKKVESYADMYEKAMKENADAFIEIAVYCIEKGLVTADKVLNDAKKAGIDFTKEKLDQIRGIKDTVKQKAGEIKDTVEGKATEIKDKVGEKAGQVKSGVVNTAKNVKKTTIETAKNVKLTTVETARKVKNTTVEKAGQVRDGATKVGHAVIEGTAMTAGAVVATGRLGKNVVLKGAKTVGEKGEKVYSAAKGTAEKGLNVVGRWFKARGKDIRDFGHNIKEGAENVIDTVEGKATQIKDNVVKTARDVRDTTVEKATEVKGKVEGKATQIKDNVVKTARDVRDTTVETARKVKNTTVEKAGQVRDGATKVGRAVIEGTAMTAGAVVATGRLGKDVVLKGAKTVGEKGEKVYSAAKGTAEKGLNVVGRWFKARGKDIKDFGTIIKGAPGKAKEAINEKVGKIKESDSYQKISKGIQDVKREVKDAPKNIEKGLENAKDRVEQRARSGISSGAKGIAGLLKGAGEFMEAFSKKIEPSVISKEEIKEEEQIAQTKEAEKENLEQDGLEM